MNRASGTYETIFSLFKVCHWNSRKRREETRMKDVCIEIMMKMSKCGKIHQFKISIQEIKFNKINSKKIMLRHITIKFLKTEMNKNI